MAQEDKAIDVVKQMIADGQISQDVAEKYFPELKESEDMQIMKEIAEFIYNSTFKPKDIKRKEKWLAWLEKKGEEERSQVYETKNGEVITYSESEGYKVVEPKFKVGDWITDGQLTCKVLSATSKSYVLNLYNDDYCHFETDAHSIDKHYHLWTIQDAKDGDVLAAKECIVLFKKIDGLNIICYCTYHYMGFNPSFYVDTLQNKSAFHPSTRDQRDILFQKIKETGYVWDGKELNKLNNL